MDDRQERRPCLPGAGRRSDRVGPLDDRDDEERDDDAGGLVRRAGVREDTGTVATQGLAITDAVATPQSKTPIAAVAVDTSARPQLAASERYCYPYKVTLPASAVDPGTNYKDTAFVSIANADPNGDPGQAHDNDHLPTTPATLDSSITVADSNGKTFAFAGSGSQGYDESIPCTAADGAHTITASNTATIQSTGQHSTAQATIHCTAPTTLTTALSQTTITTGGSVSDQATITGAPSGAGGTITYSVYSDSACQTLFADATPAVNSVSGGQAPASKQITFDNAGTFYWQATYSGDVANNAGGSSSACGSETLLVSESTAGSGSSQELIQADLDAGLIDYGTSLIYRAWALFWDARLPARYDGSGSIGEDGGLFTEIKAALPSLPPDQQAELEGWVSRPTDPLSPFGPAAAASRPGRHRRPPPPTRRPSSAPLLTWLHVDDPNDNSNTGFRGWVCAARQSDANAVLNPLLISLAGINELFTQPEPAGMGSPSRTPRRRPRTAATARSTSTFWRRTSAGTATAAARRSRARSSPLPCRTARRQGPGFPSGAERLVVVASRTLTTPTSPMRSSTSSSSLTPSGLQEFGNSHEW